LRFEWNYPIFKEKLGRFQPFLGISADPSVFYENIEPYSTATFPTIYFDARNTVSIIPRIQVSLSERLFLDLNVPISMFSSVVAFRYYGNPILPTYARRMTDFSTKFLPSNLNIRLGLAYRI